MEFPINVLKSDKLFPVLLNYLFSDKFFDNSLKKYIVSNIYTFVIKIDTGTISG